MKILTYPDVLCGDFGHHILSVKRLVEWLEKQQIELPTSPSINKFEFVQVEAFLRAIQKDVADSFSREEASDLLRLEKKISKHEAAEIAPGFVLSSNAYGVWRDKILQAIEDGQLELLDITTKLKVNTSPKTLGKKADLETQKSEFFKQIEFRAKEYIKQQAKRSCFPNQLQIGDHVASALRKEKLYGPSGKPLKGSYIKRHVLQPAKISSQQFKQKSTLTNRGK